jgi:hypothetical protein
VRGGPKDCGGSRFGGVDHEETPMLNLRALMLLVVFACSASLIDYIVVMFCPFDMGPYVLIYQFLLSISGYLASLTYLLVTRRPMEAISLLPVFAVGKFLSEHMFFVWVDLFGDVRGIYSWYTHNPLNPDGQWGYGWMILGVQGTIVNFVLIIVAYYLPAYLVSRWIVLKYQHTRGKQAIAPLRREAP